jgi:hypothetical protein
MFVSTVPTPILLGQKWACVYTDFLHSALALRELLRLGRPVGCSQDLLTRKIRDAADAADSLQSLGYSPTQHFAGQEAIVWQSALRYLRVVPWPALSADMAWVEIEQSLDRCRAEWGRLCKALVEANGDALASASVLDPRLWRSDGLSNLLGERNRQPSPQDLRQFGREAMDESFVVPLG